MYDEAEHEIGSRVTGHTGAFRGLGVGLQWP